VNDAERHKLLFGPYRPPRCRAGDVLRCEVRGEVVVAGFSPGPIRWPWTRNGGKPALIVCGDLVEAVRCEARLAVCDGWGVTAPTVWRWRKALGVPAENEGSRRLRKEVAASQPPEQLRRFLEAAHSPEARARAGASRRGRPMSPKARAALSRHRGGNRYREGALPQT
jgi:hypothetical protein